MPDNGEKSFFHTLPGILTGIAAVVTAFAGLLAALHSNGWLPEPSSTPTLNVGTLHQTPVPIAPVAPPAASLPAGSPEGAIGSSLQLMTPMAAAAPTEAPPSPPASEAAAIKKVDCDDVIKEIGSGKLAREVARDLNLSLSSVYRCKRYAQRRTTSNEGSQPATPYKGP